MRQNNGIRIPISEWFARHTVRPLLVTSALFFFSMIIMLAFIVSGGRTQSEDSATHLIRMAELATLQKNRSLMESLADLGHKDIGLQALTICDGERPLFLYPDNRTDCNLKPYFLQRLITHQIPGMDGTIIAMVIPKFPGYHLALFGAVITALFIVTIQHKSARFIVLFAQRHRQVPFARTYMPLDRHQNLHFSCSPAPTLSWR